MWSVSFRRSACIELNVRSYAFRASMKRSGFLGRILCFTALMVALAARLALADVSYVNTAKTSASSVATATISAFNPGGAKNRLLVVGLTFGQGAPTGLTVKYGAASLALVPSTSATNGNAHTELWYLVAPSTTPSNIVATWTGNHDVVMGAVAFAGVDQFQPVQYGTTATGTSVAPSVTI